MTSFKKKRKIEYTIVYSERFSPLNFWFKFLLLTIDQKPMAKSQSQFSIIKTSYGLSWKKFLRKKKKLKTSSRLKARGNYDNHKMKENWAK